MYKTSDLFAHFSKKYPLKQQEKWDQSGKIVFFNQPISNILVCLDVNDDVINEAIKKKCELIISHHPIFTNSKDVKLTPKERELINKLNSKKISLISFHTCFDNNPKGMNFSFLSKCKAFNNIKVIKNSIGSYATAELTATKSTKLLCDFIKIKLKTSRIIADASFKNEPIKKVAVCCGSGFDVLKEVFTTNNKHDAYLTGDVKWHKWQLAKLYSINLIDIGHDIENIFIEVISDELKKEFDELNVFTLPSNIKFFTK